VSSTLIVGGTVVSASGTQDADVLVEGEKIAVILARQPDLEVSMTADRIIDATGKYVLPGGIDVHTHMEMPFGGTFSVDTFETGTRAAAWGGTTTIVDFAVQAKGTSLLATLDKWHAKADGNCAIDYGFHMIVSDVNDATLKEMDACIAAGVNSFKMFMAYPGVFYATDGEILLAMQQAARSGATVMMHAENGIAIDQLVAQAIAAGRTDPVNHGLTRPPELEGEATSRAITLAKVADCPLYIVHLSASQALAAVAEARDTGQNVFAETCPQYLFLSLDDLARPDFEGAKFVASPPLRPKEHQDSLWRGLRTNDLSVVSTDHCPFCFKDQKELGRGDFSKIPNGIPGVEHRMDLLHAGVVAGQLSLPRWVEVASTTPARMFGLYPRKGVIAAGSDADIVIYDPAARQTLSAATHHMNVDYSAYEGMELTGRVVTTLSRGRPVIDEGSYAGSTGHGTFLSRGLNQYLLLQTNHRPFGICLWRGHGFRGGAADEPAGQRRDRDDAAGRGGRFLLRVDVGFARALAGAVRHLLADPGRDQRDDRGPDGDQPGHQGLVGHRLAVRHAERHVRQPDRVRDRPRRLGPAGHRPAAHVAGHAVRGDDRDQGPGRGTRGHPARPAAADSVGAGRQAGDLDGRVRPEGAQAHRRAGRRLHPADR
jgi:dihydropyrimidinase